MYNNKKDEEEEAKTKTKKWKGKNDRKEEGGEDKEEKKSSDKKDKNNEAISKIIFYDGKNKEWTETDNKKDEQHRDFKKLQRKLEKASTYLTIPQAVSTSTLQPTCWCKRRFRIKTFKNKMDIIHPRPPSTFSKPSSSFESHEKQQAWIFVFFEPSPQYFWQAGNRQPYYCVRISSSSAHPAVYFTVIILLFLLFVLLLLFLIIFFRSFAYCLFLFPQICSPRCFFLQWMFALFTEINSEGQSLR